MAKKILKTRTQFTSTLENNLYAALKELSGETKVPISKLLDEAVRSLLEERQ
jgi:predicted DNA-binding ribbon-helix-helix protein